MKVGFTGTRRGMSVLQAEAFRVLIDSLGMTEFHHGDCCGSDDQAANMIVDQGFTAVKIVAHPPLDDKYRAFNAWATETRERKGYHERNRDIVAETEILIATPLESMQMPCGGTWYTFQHAYEKLRDIRVIWRSGHVSAIGDKGVMKCS